MTVHFGVVHLHQSIADSCFLCFQTPRPRLCVDVERKNQRPVSDCKEIENVLLGHNNLLFHISFQVFYESISGGLPVRDTVPGPFDMNSPIQASVSPKAETIAIMEGAELFSTAAAAANM